MTFYFMLPYFIDGNINWKDFMYNQYSLCVDDMNVCIDQVDLLLISPPFYLLIPFFFIYSVPFKIFNFKTSFQEFIIEPFSATIHFGTHLIADSSILPFELPSLTATCAFHRLNISVTPSQYVMLVSKQAEKERREDKKRKTRHFDKLIHNWLQIYYLQKSQS